MHPNLDDTMRGTCKVRAVAVVYGGDHGGVGQLFSYQPKHSLCGGCVKTLGRFVEEQQAGPGHQST